MDAKQAIAMVKKRLDKMRDDRYGEMYECERRYDEKNGTRLKREIDLLDDVERELDDLLSEMD